MGNWITLSSSDIRDHLSADELELLSTEALGENQDDPVPALISGVVARVRAEVAAHSSNSLDPDSSTVPPELAGAAIDLVIEAAYARLPGIALSADRVRLANAARAILRRVAAGEIAVSSGVSTASSASSGSAPKVVLLASRSRPVTGASLAGL